MVHIQAISDDNPSDGEYQQIRDHSRGTGMEESESDDEDAAAAQVGPFCCLP